MLGFFCRAVLPACIRLVRDVNPCWAGRRAVAVLSAHGGGKVYGAFGFDCAFSHAESLAYAVRIVKRNLAVFG